MSISIGLKRKRQCIVMAIDKSGSMSGARMEAAKEGASMVLNELLDGDLAAVKVFNDKVKDLGDGVTQIDAETKRSLCSQIRSITADGMTSLYDVTLASGLEIMQTSAAVKAFGGRELPCIRLIDLKLTSLKEALQTVLCYAGCRFLSFCCHDSTCSTYRCRVFATIVFIKFHIPYCFI
jgi:hypothetical protein